MDNKALHDKFRMQFANLHAITVLTVSLFEIIGYIVLIRSGVERFALDNAYLWYGVVLPILVNTINHLIARSIVTKQSTPRNKKNQSVVSAALVTACVVAVIHKEYIVTSCAFIFPIILSAAFNDKRLLNHSFIGSVMILICVGVSFWLDKAITLTTMLNLFILFGFAFISYLCGIISIDFSAQNYSTIESQAKQNNKLMENVLHDQMTGLFNHHAFTTQLDTRLADYDESLPLCLAMVDVDDFKLVNDTYGHDCGDEVLIYLAQTIQKHCQDQALAYRYGGEEFTIVFPDKSIDDACSIIQDILEEFRCHTFSFTDRSITFSAGVARYTPGWSRDQLFERADKTLYTAKHAGKNQVLAEECCPV